MFLLQNLFFYLFLKKCVFSYKSTLLAADFGFEDSNWPAGRSLPTPEFKPIFFPTLVLIDLQ